MAWNSSRAVDFWDRAAEKYEASRISDEVGYARTLMAIRQRLHRDNIVLEIGCGTGTTALRLAHSVRRLVASDISSQMILIAGRKAVMQKVGNVEFVVADALSGPEGADQYDVVLALNLLHLVPSIPETLAAAFRRLKPGGLFISKTPCISLMNPFVRVAIPVMQAVGRAPAIKVLSVDNLASDVLEAGFDIEEQSWHGSRGRDFRPFLVARRPVVSSRMPGSPGPPAFAFAEPPAG